MAGHNKWSKIKHKKAVGDAAKSKIFGKMSKLITTESKLCGGDINSPSLRAAIEKAKSVNMTSDNIDRAVKRGLAKDAETLEKITYEAFGPGGVAMLIVALTANRNKTAAEIRHILSKNNIDLGTPGSASWAFEITPIDATPKTTTQIEKEDEEKLQSIVELLLEQEDTQEVYTNNI